MKPYHISQHSIRQFSMRIFVILAVMLLITGLVSPAGNEMSPTAVSAASEATAVNVGMQSDVLTLDPALAYDLNTWLVVAQLFDTLTVQPSDGSPLQPGLALSWAFSQDGLTWTFNLRPGVTFHDGTPLDAQAVVFNFERWWDPENPYHGEDALYEYFYYMMGGYKGDEGCILSAVNAIGSDQVQLVLAVPQYNLPNILSSPAVGIASPAAIQAGTLASHPVGSGAFTFVQRVVGESIELAANPVYWGTPPSIDTLRFLVIPEADARLLALQSGEIDSVGDLPNDLVQTAVAQPSLQVEWRLSSALAYLGINRSHSPLDNPAVRQAIAHAINLPELVEQHYPFGEHPADQFLPPAIWGRDAELSAYTYDPALSISLLQLAGYTEGITTTLAYRDVYRSYLPDPLGAANAISDYLEAVGIHAEVIGYENAEFIDKLGAGELDLFLLGWYADYLHPDNFFSLILCNPTNLSFGALDETLCNLVEAAKTEPDLAVQVALYESASQYVYDSLPLLPIIHIRSALVMHYDIAGVQASPLGLEAYKDASYPGAQQVILSPEEDTSLVFTGEDSQTTIEVPAGAVTEDTLLRLVVTEPASAPLDMSSAGNSFELEASIDGDVLLDFAFLEPVTMTINYADADINWLKEETLLLYYWDGSQWLDAATTCDPTSSYTRDLAANLISLEVCHLTPFGLFAEAQPVQFLPLVRK